MSSNQNDLTHAIVKELTQVLNNIAYYNLYVCHNDQHSIKYIPGNNIPQNRILILRDGNYSCVAVHAWSMQILAITFIYIGKYVRITIFNDYIQSRFCGLSVGENLIFHKLNSALRYKGLETRAIKFDACY